MGCSSPGFPVPHYLPVFAQTPVPWVSDAIQPSHPLPPPSPPALSLSHHQGLFQWVSSSHQVAKGLKLQVQHQYFQWIFRIDFLGIEDSEESSPTPQLESISFSLLNLLYHPTLTSVRAAAAKSLQLCPTLCDPIEGSLPGFPVPGILQTRTLEWVAIFFSNAWKWKVKVKLLSRVQLIVTPWTAAHQAPPSMGFSRPEYWSGVPLPSPHPCMTTGQTIALTI